MGVPTAIEYAEVLWARAGGTFTPRVHNELTVTSKNRTRVDVCLDLTLIVKGDGIAPPEVAEMVEERRMPGCSLAGPVGRRLDARVSSEHACAIDTCGDDIETRRGRRLDKQVDTVFDGPSRMIVFA